MKRLKLTVDQVVEMVRAREGQATSSVDILVKLGFESTNARRFTVYKLLLEGEKRGDLISSWDEQFKGNKFRAARFTRDDGRTFPNTVAGILSSWSTPKGRR